MRFVVCNGAEGEPGTFKDRAILRHNPYQVIEGLAIAAFVIGATHAFLATKAAFTREVEALRRALAEMSAAGLAGDVPITIVLGPDSYLFGEEKALLEVIEGEDPLPRRDPPYRARPVRLRGRRRDGRPATSWTPGARRPTRPS